MEITSPMVWTLFVAVISVVVGVILARSLGKKDDLVSEKTLKLILAPVSMNIENILVKCESLDNRVSNLERRRDVTDKGRIQRS